MRLRLFVVIVDAVAVVICCCCCSFGYCGGSYVGVLLVVVLVVVEVVFVIVVVVFVIAAIDLFVIVTYSFRPSALCDNNELTEILSFDPFHFLVGDTSKDFLVLSLDVRSLGERLQGIARSGCLRSSRSQLPRRRQAGR